METNAPHPTAADSAAYREGYEHGIRPSIPGWRSHRNPYDRRTRTGKEWESGSRAGLAWLSLNGALAASQYLANRGDLAAIVTAALD